MPSKKDGATIGDSPFPEEWVQYRLLPFSPAEAFLYCINDFDAKSDDGYIWHGKCEGEKLFNSRKVVESYVKRPGENKICVRQIDEDFIDSVSDWARWFYLWHCDGEVMFGLSDWRGAKRIDLRAFVDWKLVCDCSRGVQEDIYPLGWQNKSNAVIEPHKFISDILYAVKHKYQYEFERDWTFYLTNGDGTIFLIKDWEDFQNHLRQYRDIQVQKRLLNDEGADCQLEVKYSYSGGNATLYGVGDPSPCGKDFLSNCVRYHGDLDHLDWDEKFALPLPMVKPEIVREY